MLVGMAAAVQHVTLKNGNEPLLKFRAGTKVESILHQLAAVCPGGRIEDSGGFVVTLGYDENLTESEYTVIVPTPTGAVTVVPANCIFTLCLKGAVADFGQPDTPTQLHPALLSRTCNGITLPVKQLHATYKNNSDPRRQGRCL